MLLMETARSHTTVDGYLLAASCIGAHVSADHSHLVCDVPSTWFFAKRASSVQVLVAPRDSPSDVLVGWDFVLQNNQRLLFGEVKREGRCPDGDARLALFRGRVSRLESFSTRQPHLA